MRWRFHVFKSPLLLTAVLFPLTETVGALAAGASFAIVRALES